MQSFQIMLHFEHFSRDKNEEKLKRPTVAKIEKKMDEAHSKYR